MQSQAGQEMLNGVLIFFLWVNQTRPRKEGMLAFASSRACLSVVGHAFPLLQLPWGLRRRVLSSSGRRYSTILKEFESSGRTPLMHVTLFFCNSSFQRECIAFGESCVLRHRHPLEHLAVWLTLRSFLSWWRSFSSRGLVLHLRKWKMSLFRCSPISIHRWST